MALWTAPPQLSLTRKLIEFSWGLTGLLIMIGGVGVAMLYSVADGDFDPWARRHIIRFAAGLGLMFAIALIDVKVWRKLAYPIYGAALGLVIAVMFFGRTGMGAQRWIDLGFFQLQPSEIMKIALVLALARWYHGLKLTKVSRLIYLIPPLAMIAVPTAFVLKQPDLGTAILLIGGGLAMMFLAGVSWWFFGLGAAGAVGAVAIGYQFLRDYQKRRIEVFLEPEQDPLGAGYHIMQSKIAFGSGGVDGRGFLQGPQSHLNFLPEKQTDFIFTMLAEEFGLIGGLLLMSLYVIVIAYGFFIAFQSRSHFGRLLALGVVTTFFLYVFVNMAMVMGLVPVVGVPLPFVSYGGTSMLTLLIGFGLVISTHIHRHDDIPVDTRV